MESKLLHIAPVLPSQNIARDTDWYINQVGFVLMHRDDMYAVMGRAHLRLHLQWHADTPDDPLLGGSVIRIFVEDIQPIFQELLSKGTVHKDKLSLNTPWDTHEFGFYDLNNNAIFFVQDAK